MSGAPAGDPPSTSRDEHTNPTPAPKSEPADLPVDARVEAEEASPVLRDATPPVPAQVPAEMGDSVARAPEPRGRRTLLAVLGVEPERAPAWDAADTRHGVTLVPYRDLAALVVADTADSHPGEPRDVTARHWEVHRALLRGSVAPAPLGVTFDSDEGVVQFLSEAYATLKGALARVEGRWEFRLHVDLLESALSESLALDLVTHIYAELRRISHAAIPFPRETGRLLSAAFLVDRTTSTSFKDRVEELGRVNAALALDLTGPWPPYDFVHMKA
jgi:hypothetical protein